MDARTVLPLQGKQREHDRPEPMSEDELRTALQFHRVYGWPPKTCEAVARFMTAARRVHSLVVKS